MQNVATRVLHAGARLLRPAPRVRKCGKCGKEQARRVCCGGAAGHLAVCAACGHVETWER